MITPLLESSNYIDTLKVPKNFEITLFAENLDSPRQITETKKGHIIVGSKKGTEVIALTDRNNDKIFEEQVVVANNLQNPAGVAYFKGDLYFAEMDTIWIIKNIDEWLDLSTNSSASSGVKDIYFPNLFSLFHHMKWSIFLLVE